MQMLISLTRYLENRSGNVNQLKHPRTGYRLRCGDYRLFFDFTDPDTIAQAKALGAKNRMHKTKVSRIVATLLARGLISRRSNYADLRQSLLHLTPLGQHLHEECTPLAADLAKRLEDAIEVADREVVDRCLTRLMARSEQLISAGAHRRGR